MIKGLAITPPVLGRISIGRIVEKDGKRLPEKDDQFTITSQMQSKDGWINHPLDSELRQQAEGGKLRSIPVTMLILISTFALSTHCSTVPMGDPSVPVTGPTVVATQPRAWPPCPVHRRPSAPWEQEADARPMAA